MNKNDDISNNIKSSLDEIKISNSRLIILLKNIIDAYDDECDYNSPEHFLKKLMSETGITENEYNIIYANDRQIINGIIKNI